MEKGRFLKRLIMASLMVSTEISSVLIVNKEIRVHWAVSSNYSAET